MATIAGGQLRTPRGTLNWLPAAPVAKAYQFLTKAATDKYKCLGVVGNWEHLTAGYPGDHTPYSTHDLRIGGKHYVPKRGWVYAIDATVPEPEKFERWFLGRLRAGYYRCVKYWNILNRHWHRTVVKGGKPFGKPSWSGDHHLHMSIMPGSEYSTDDILGDYEHWRTTGKNRQVKIPAQRPRPSAPAKPAARPMDTAAGKLPTLRRGSHGIVVKVAQACLVTRELWARNNASARKHIDGQYGPGTEAKIKEFQRQATIPVTGVVDARTWAALVPDHPSTVTRGSHGWYTWLIQCLLLARGFNPGFIDGIAGEPTVEALKRFQAARRVPKSVYRGRGDGIAGTETWVAFVTF